MPGISYGGEVFLRFGPVLCHELDVLVVCFDEGAEQVEMQSRAGGNIVHLLPRNG